MKVDRIRLRSRRMGMLHMSARCNEERGRAVAAIGHCGLSTRRVLTDIACAYLSLYTIRLPVSPHSCGMIVV